MLDVLRRNAGSWAIKIILTFIALTFVIWGVGSYTEKDRNWAARVGKTEITAAQLGEAAASLEKAYREVYGNAFTPEMVKALKLREQALNTLVKQALLLAEARKMGLVASDVEIQRDIASNPAFQANGQFSEAQYRATLQRNRITTTEYESAKRDEITIRKMEGLIASSARVSEAEARDLYELTSRKVRLVVATADPEKVASPAIPSEAEIAAKYEQTRESLRIPARVRMLIARFSPDVFAKDAVPTDNEVRSFYEGNADRFRTDESRLVAQALVPAGKDKDAALRKAEAIVAEAARGKAEFEAAAKKNGAGKPAAAWATRKELRPEIVDAVFGTPVDQAAGPVEVKGGYLVARVNQIRFPETMPLEQVRDRAAALLKREKGKDAAVIEAYKAQAKAAESKDLKAACAPYRVVPSETGWATGAGKGEEIPPAVVEEALLLPAKEVGPVKTIGDVHYLFQVIAKEESRLPPLSEARDAVKAAVLKDKRRAAAQAALEKARAAAKTGAELERNARQAGLAVATTPFFSPLSDTPPEPIAAAGDVRRELIALTQKSPVAARVYPAGPRFIALAFAGEQGADQKTWESKKAALIAALGERKKSDVTAAWLEEWRKASKVEVNPEVLK